MKRETLRHPKTDDLASRLGVTRAQALGHLLLLWDWTTEVALAGNVGKWPNGSIARACDWSQNADTFVDALVDAGWLDRDEDHRLVIHDWSQHCENWVRAKAQKLGIKLLGELNIDSYDPDLRAGLKSGSLPRDRTEPILTKPNQPQIQDAPEAADSAAAVDKSPKKSNPRKPAFDPLSVPVDESLDTPRFRESWSDWISHCAGKKKTYTEQSIKRILNKLKAWGADRAVAAIELSIERNWEGIYEAAPASGTALDLKATHRPSHASTPRIQPISEIRTNSIGGIIT